MIIILKRWCLTTRIWFTIFCFEGWLRLCSAFLCLQFYYFSSQFLTLMFLNIFERPSANFPIQGLVCSILSLARLVLTAIEFS